MRRTVTATIPGCHSQKALNAQHPPLPPASPTPFPAPQIFSRIRQHAERTKRDGYSWADLLDFLGTSFKVSGGGLARGQGVLC